MKLERGLLEHGCTGALFLFLLGSSGHRVEAVVREPGLYPPENLLRVNLCDTTELAPITLAELKREVSAIYSRADMRIVWEERCGCEETPGEMDRPNFASVYVLGKIPAPVTFRKNKKRFERMPVMGYTLTTPGGAPGPVIYVSRKAVEKHVRLNAKSPSLLARALGRIIAHELAHRFLQSRHLSEGILRAEIPRKDWTDVDSRDLYFTAEQARHLRSVGESSVWFAGARGGQLRLSALAKLRRDE
jgi:hypothetical protein